MPSGAGVNGAGSCIRYRLPLASTTILDIGLTQVPLRSPITRDAQDIRCGSSSLRRHSVNTDPYQGSDEIQLEPMIAPQAPQYSSTRLLSFCILLSPQAGQGGRPFSLGATLGPVRRFFLRGTYQPDFGFLTFGILVTRYDIVGSLKTLADRECEGVVR